MVLGLSAGTASLLIGATLVFGINGQVKAAGNGQYRLSKWR